MLFFGDSRALLHCSVSRSRCKAVSLEEARKIGIFWVSVNFILCFIYFNYMLYVTPLPFPLPLFPSPTPTLFLFKCSWMKLVFIIIKQLYKSFLTMLFPEYAGHCPVAVSAKANVRQFFRREDEDQQLSSKCAFLFPSLFCVL